MLCSYGALGSSVIGVLNSSSSFGHSARKLKHPEGNLAPNAAVEVRRAFWQHGLPHLQVDRAEYSAAIRRHMLAGIAFNFPTFYVRAAVI